MQKCTTWTSLCTFSFQLIFWKLCTPMTSYVASVCQIFLKLLHLQLNHRIFCFKIIKWKHVIVLKYKGGSCVILSLMHLFYSPRLHTKTLLFVDIQVRKWWWWTCDSKCLNMVTCNYQNVVAWTWMFPWDLDFDRQQCASSKKTKTFLLCTICLHVDGAFAQSVSLLVTLHDCMKAC